MNVLIATPTYADKLQPETAAAVKAQKFTGSWEWRVYRNNPSTVPCMANVQAQYRHIREDFLAGPWDALLTVEHDMVPPENALQDLWDADKPVAYGVYMLRHGSLVLNAWEYAGPNALGESLSLQTRRQHKIEPEGVVRVSGIGFGCTLIRREVMERLQIHGGGNPDQSPDVPFAYDCNREGIEQVAHFGVLCGHIEGGRVLMPAGTSAVEVKVMALQTLNANVGGSSVHMDAGQEYTIIASAVSDLVRANYVRVIDASAGSGNALLQAPDDAPAQHPKPAKAKRKRLGTNVSG